MRKVKRIVIGNWKMAPNTLREAKSLFSGIRKKVTGLKKTRVVMCPPFVYMGEFGRSSAKSDVLLGAQDVFWKEEGAFTGEVSARQLYDIGVSYVIVGHSERRELGENDETVSRKIQAVLSKRMTAVLCVGEKMRDEEGRHLEFLEEEIKNSLRGVSGGMLGKGLVLAYEPIWAIGKRAKDAMNPQELHKMTLFVRKILVSIYGRDMAMKIPVLYGGSVEKENAEELMRDGDVDGFLVGHASLNASDFEKIVKAVENA